MTATVRVVLATHNQYKVDEFQRILGGSIPELEIIAYDGPEPIEDGITFLENALIKARAAAAHTGLPALADDSGICVAVLGGAPGIFSARWAGRHGDALANLTLLLDQLADVREADRSAQFRSTIALVVPSVFAPDDVMVAEGVWPGRVAREARGNAGFGYDPIFVPSGGTQTAAELGPDRKNSESHRARAFTQIAPALRKLAARG